MLLNELGLYKTSFHSFEVGFGLIHQEVTGKQYIGFHSFEVGFGLQTRIKLSDTSYQFSFLRGRLRTRFSSTVATCASESFHSFEVGFGRESEIITFYDLTCFHSFEVGFGQRTTFFL